MSTSSTTHQSRFLQNYSNFYTKLSAKGQKEFALRVNTFIAKKHWQFGFNAGKDQLLIKTLIAASCIEITWGIRDRFISSYKFIAVYENGIKLRENKDSGKILWLSGNIQIPWARIKEGFSFSAHASIGLYEWSRALIVVAKKNNITDDFFSAYFKVWCEAARDIAYSSGLDENLPLDAFAKQLPLAVKQFFEEPAALQSKYPELYEHTKRLLNIDPEAKEFDFVYSEKVRAEKKIRSKNRALLFGVQKQVRNYGISSGVMYGILIQIPLVVIIWAIMGRKTYSSAIFYAIYSGICLLGIAFIYWFYYIKRGLSVKSTAVLCGLGLLPCVYTFMILLNFCIPVKTNLHTIHVQNVNGLWSEIPWGIMNNPKVTKFMIHRTDRETGKVEVQDISAGSDVLHYAKDMNSNDNVDVHTYTGIFGAEVYQSFEITMYYQ